VTKGGVAGGSWKVQTISESRRTETAEKGKKEEAKCKSWGKKLLNIPQTRNVLRKNKTMLLYKSRCSNNIQISQKY